MKNYKLIKEVEVSKNSSDQNIRFELPISGGCEAFGEFYYNQKMKRYEHTAVDTDGSKYLAVWK